MAIGTPLVTFVGREADSAERPMPRGNLASGGGEGGGGEAGGADPVGADDETGEIRPSFRARRGRRQGPLVRGLWSSGFTDSVISSLSAGRDGGGDKSRALEPGRVGSHPTSSAYQQGALGKLFKSGWTLVFSSVKRNENDVRLKGCSEDLVTHAGTGRGTHRVPSGYHLLFPVAAQCRVPCCSWDAAVKGGSQREPQRQGHSQAKQ